MRTESNRLHRTKITHTSTNHSTGKTEMETLKTRARRNQWASDGIDTCRSCVWADTVALERCFSLEKVKGFYERGVERCSWPCHCAAINYLYLCFQAKHRPSFWHLVRASSGVCSPELDTRPYTSMINSLLSWWMQTSFYDVLSFMAVIVRLRTGPDFLVWAEHPPR